MLKRTLTAIVLAGSAIVGCDQSKQPGTPVTAQSYSDEILKLAKSKIDNEDYNSAINLLEGYSTNDSNLLAERTFLLGEANLKSLDNEQYKDMCHFVRIRGVPPQWRSKVDPTRTEIFKLYKQASSYFDSAIELSSDLENRLGGIYLARNGKVLEPSDMDSRPVNLLKKLYFGLKKNNLNLIEEAIELNLDYQSARLSKIKQLFSEKQKREREISHNYGSELPKPISVDATEAEKRMQEREIREGKERYERNKKILQPKLDALEREFAEKEQEIRRMPDSELMETALNKVTSKVGDNYGTYWLERDAIIIIKSDNDSAKLLTFERAVKYNYPFLQQRVVKVSKNGKLESFGNNFYEAGY